MKLLYATDLHGDKDKYKKLFELALENDIKLIINGGDMLPKQCNRHIEQPLFIKKFLRDYFGKLQQEGIIFLVMLGNDDLQSLDDLFDDVCNEFNNIYNIANNKVKINDYEFIGMNHILDHPFSCKDRVVMEDQYIPQKQLSMVAGISTESDYDKIYDWTEYSKTKLLKMSDILNKLPQPQNIDKTIYVMHMPPAGLHLGQLRYQDLDIGSEEIFIFLKEHQPLLTLHGHIHESPDTEKGVWLNKINQTICIQTGQTEFHDEILIYAEIDLDNQDYKFKTIAVNEESIKG